ncbi:MAG: DUF2780 domain-containing protein [Hahellaceae bacterium]|nr:DUF2780 domain-containing protein [Hahellaceae bacterium]MCP5212564.1 DUF2780 domain-containing protein [Hahellaceae bacterium]
MKKQNVLGLVLLSFAVHSQAGINSLGSALEKASDGIAATQTVLAPAADSNAATTDLVNMAMSQLNLSQPQAEGGLGALFGLTKSNLSAGEFSQLSKGVPGIDTLLAAVPASLSGGSGGGLGGVVTSLAEGAGVMDQFAALGISPEMVAPLVDIVLQYLGQGGDGGLSDLFSKGLGGLLGE